MTKRGRGKRAGRSHTRAPEKVITGPLGALLIAERAAILSGRDDEFVMVATGFYTGMRFGELAGLESRYARLGSIRVEWQLCEVDAASCFASRRRMTASGISTRRRFVGVSLEPRRA